MGSIILSLIEKNDGLMVRLLDGSRDATIKQSSHQTISPLLPVIQRRFSIT